MTAAELIRVLEKNPDLDVEIMDDDGYDSRDVSVVIVESVTRGIALPQPRTYNIIRLASGGEGPEED